MDCPMCKEGKLESSVKSEIKTDLMHSIAMGMIMGGGFIPTTKLETYTEYKCDKCGYTYRG